MLHPTVLAEAPEAQIPSFLNGNFLFGLAVAAFVFMAIIGVIRMTPNAHNERTSKVASGGLNYIILAAVLTLLIGGGVFLVASGAIDNLTNGVNT